MQERPQQSRGQFVLVWIAVLAAALMIDGPIARAMVPWHLTIKHSEAAEELKQGGHAGVTCAAILLVLTLDSRKWRAASLLGIGAVLVGLLRFFLAVAAGRTRPIIRIAPFEFSPFSGGSDGLFSNLSFPSGHASLAFSTAAALSYLFPKGKGLFFAAAALVGLERIAENAHYVSDVLAAALLGILSFRCALSMNQYLWYRLDHSAESIPLQSVPHRLAE